MAVFYMDYENGNDGNDGTTFANRWKTTTNGATAARVSPNDVVRIMGSPAQTSLGINGTWTDGPLKSTVAITSSTNATPIVITSATHSLTTGDTVVITGHTTNTNANGTWEVNVLTSTTFELTGSVGNGVGAAGTVRNVNNCRVKLASALTKTVAKCDFQEGAWTASANVTATINTTDMKQGYGSSSIAIAAGFTTGLAAYKALSGITDFSAYKQVTFYIKQTAGTVGAAGATTISLCTDALGVVPAQTVNVPALAVIGQWVPVTVDTGAALSAIIQSVAFNVVTDNGAQTFLISNIEAAKDSTSADSLSLTSLIGKNTGNETWCGIQSIVGTRVMLDQGSNAIPTSALYRGYAGTTETVTAYKRETIKTTMVAAVGNIANQIMDSGSLAGGYLYFEGGWNRTDMSIQTLETWFDGQNGMGAGISSTNNYISLNKINGVRYSRLLIVSAGSQWLIDNISANNCTVPTLTGAIYFTGTYGVQIGTINSVSYNTGTTSGSGIHFTGASNIAGCSVAHLYHCDGNSINGISIGGQSSGAARSIVLNDVYCNNNGSAQVQLNVQSSEVVFNGLSIKNGGAHALGFAGDGAIVNNLTTSGNTNYAISCNAGRNYITNASISEATEVNLSAGLDGFVQSQNHDGTPDNHQIFTDGGRISAQTAVRHTASGIAWQMAVTSVTRTVLYPLRFTLAPIMCEANKLFTFTAWYRRTNTGITAKLVCKGGQIAGVAADVTASMTAAADTWEQLSISFTPTVTGAVELTAEAYGGSTYSVFIDDLDWTSA